jgi:hypothetical protein
MPTLPATPIGPEPVQSRPPFLSKWTLPNTQVASCANHDHFAIIYENPEDQLDFIVPYLWLGLERGEKSVYIYDDNSAETVIAAMERHGIDVGAATACGALSIITKSHAYLKNGDFDPDWMIDFLARAVEDAKKEGFPAVRASGEMTWALGPTGDAHHRLLEYECKLNAFFADFDMGGICQYNRQRFSASTLMHVIHTHRKVVFRGNVCENPYYIPPEILLRQGDGAGDALLRMLESMAENTRLRGQLAACNDALRRSEKLAVAARMATLFACGISNPIEAMSNMHYLLQLEDMPRDARKYLHIMGDELDRVRHLSKQALDAFREAGSPGGADLHNINSDRLN